MPSLFDPSVLIPSAAKLRVCCLGTLGQPLKRTGRLAVEGIVDAGSQ